MTFPLDPNAPGMPGAIGGPRSPHGDPLMPRPARDDLAEAIARQERFLRRRAARMAAVPDVAPRILSGPRCSCHGLTTCSSLARGYVHPDAGKIGAPRRSPLF